MINKGKTFPGILRALASVSSTVEYKWALRSGRTADTRTHSQESSKLCPETSGNWESSSGSGESFIPEDRVACRVTFFSGV